MIGSEPDKKVLAAARDGDNDAFRCVVEAYQALVYNLAYRLTYDSASAEDLAQECFLRVHRFFDRYDLSLPFRPWLVRLVFNTGLNWLRGQRKHGTARQSRDPDDLDPRRALPAGGGPSDPAELAESEELRRMIRRAVAALPADYKAVIALRYFEGMEYRAIAQTLNVPMGTVKIRLYRAREALRRKLATVVQTQ